MNLRQLREECWDVAREIDTPDSDRLWPLAQMNRYINRVYREIARETQCITDSTTPEICQILSEPVDYTTYEEGTLDYLWANDPNNWLYQQNVCPYNYALDPRILEITQAKWDTRAWNLVRVSWQKWVQNVYWERTMGEPTEYALDYQNKTLTINYRSQVTDIIRLSVIRMPLVDLIDDDDEPEFRTHYHDFMINGILAQMYGKQDAEAFDKEQQEKYAALYRKDIDEIKQQQAILNRRLSPNSSMLGFR